MSASNQIETTEEPTSQQPVLVNKKICAVAQEQFRSTKKVIFVIYLLHFFFINNNQKDF